MSATETPAARTYADLIADCVHCGFCLPACPTYVSWGNEMDSPRGRIDLMKGVHEGTIALDETVIPHFDKCLGCMACVTACPSGVRYDLLIEETRVKIEDQKKRDPLDQGFRDLVFALFPRPDRLKMLAPLLYFFRKSGLQKLTRDGGLTSLLPKRLRQLDELTPPLELSQLRTPLPAYTAAKRTKRGTVALIAGCVQRVFFPNVNASTIRVLAAEGFDVVVLRDQGCCGALSLHAGRADESAEFARALLDRFIPAENPHALDRYDAVLINAAGCGSTLKQYGTLFAGDPIYGPRAATFAAKIRDINEFLGGIEPLAPRKRAPIRVAYHDACHLAHAQGIRDEPRALLRSIPGLELVEIPQGEQCCGSAGVYNLLEPDSAAEIGERKVDNILSVAPQLLASANPGCTLQIRSILARRGIDLPAAHPIEILDVAVS
jgi:glycolate oxidase iron-sulfur subunit